MEKERQKHTSGKTFSGLDLTIHFDEMREILHIIDHGMDESGPVANHLLEAAMEKIRQIGLREFKNWTREGEQTKHMYRLIVSKLEKQACMGHRVAIEFLAELEGRGGYLCQ